MIDPRVEEVAEVEFSTSAEPRFECLVVFVVDCTQS
jgi:hypothetical protein